MSDFLLACCLTFLVVNQGLWAGGSAQESGVQEFSFLKNLEVNLWESLTMEHEKSEASECKCEQNNGDELVDVSSYIRSQFSKELFFFFSKEQSDSLNFIKKANGEILVSQGVCDYDVGYRQRSPLLGS